MESQYPRQVSPPTIGERISAFLRKARYRFLRLFVRSRRNYRRFDETKGSVWRQKAADTTNRVVTRAGHEIDELVDDTRRTYDRFRPKADTEAQKLKKEAKRRYKIARVKAKIIGAATLLWTRRIMATIYLAIVIGGLAFLVYWLSREEAPGLDFQTTLQCRNCELFSVTGIVDGDTIWVAEESERIRIYGADTPEIEQPCYDDATDAMREMAGSFVRVESGPRATDPYGRPLYYLYTESGDSIDELLVRNGLAYAWQMDGQHKELLIDLERQAAANDIGCLWG